MALSTIGTNSIADDAVTAAKATGFGKIAQVVTVEKAPAENSTSGTSFVTPSGASINITPSATTSKVLVMVQGGGTAVPDGGNAQFTIYRGSTNLGNSSYGFQRQYNDERSDQPLSMQVLDTPNSTSQQTYAIYYKSASSSNVYMHQTVSGVITLIAMEILA